MSGQEKLTKINEVLYRNLKEQLTDAKALEIIEKVVNVPA